MIVRGLAIAQGRASGGDYKGKTREVQTKQRGSQTLGTAGDLDAVTTADQDAPVLGLVDDGNDKGSDKSFFLQVESASMDKRDHAADPSGQIGETVVFDEAVPAAIEFARRMATHW